MDCRGGFMNSAFLYVKGTGGIDTEESYPYTANDGRCLFNKANVGATDTGFAIIQPGSEMQLMKALATVGLVFVGIDARLPSFRFYSNGLLLIYF
ncbi:unnamed protein product [Ixodes hexagonus]